MQYLNELRAFHVWSETQSITANDIALWFTLMQIANAAYWKEPLFIPVSTLMTSSKLGRGTVYRSRDHLRELGLIEYEQRKGNQSASYHLNSVASLTETQAAVEDEFVSHSGTQNDDVCPTLEHIASHSGTIYRHKDIKDTPYSPPKGEGLFDEFWKAYPRKVGKDAARKAFAKRKPTRELLDQMLAAIEKQKKGDQWQRERGKYIPHPTTWLNQGRWEDEVEESTPRDTRAYKILT